MASPETFLTDGKFKDLLTGNILTKNGESAGLLTESHITRMPHLSMTETERCNQNKADFTEVHFII